MGILLDSSVLIDLDRRQRRFPHAWLDEEIGIAAITAAELLAGVLRADAPHHAQRSAFVEGILAATPVVPFELVAARLYAQVEFDLAVAGTPIDHNDLQIAATALARGWGVATLNVGDFGRVQGLVVLGPGNEHQA